MSEAETKSVEKKHWTSGDLRALIRGRFPKDAWAVLFEVRSETGLSGAGRSADALAMSLWPSRGLEVHGFEIKVSRSDWKRELEAPEKAEPIARFCDRWWIVAPEGVVLREELPPTWGLLVPDAKGKSLRNAVTAPKAKPRALDRGFVASVLRSAQSQITPEVELEKVRSEAAQKGREEGIEIGRVEGDYQAKKLRESIEAFEKGAGVALSSRPWAALQIGQAVKVALSGNGDGALARMRRAEAVLRSALEAVEIVTGTRPDPEAPVPEPPPTPASTSPPACARCGGALTDGANGQRACSTCEPHRFEPCLKCRSPRLSCSC